MDESTITARSLSRQYGALVAVAGLDFDIRPGEIVGLVGPNGAGKTTLLRMLTASLPPSSGSAAICGFDVASQPVEVKRRIGFAPDGDAVFESLTGLEFLEMVATLHSVPSELAHERINRLVDLLDLGRPVLAEALLGTYSKGMRRKVTITSALLHNPPVVLLDEPLEGLDPTASLAFKALIRSLAGEGKTVIYSSHLLDVVERVCDRVIIMDHGRIVLDGAPDALIAARKSTTLEALFAQLTTPGSIEAKVADVARALGSGGRPDIARNTDASPD